MHKALLPLIVVFAYLALAGGTPVHAQNVTVTITMRGASKRVDSGLAWVVDPRATLKSPAVDVSAADPAVRASCPDVILVAAVKAKLNRVVLEMEGANQPWLLESLAGGSARSFWGKLSSYYDSSFNPNPVADTVAGTTPARAGVTLAERWTIEYTPQIVRAFQIKLTTEKAAANEAAGQANRTASAATMADVVRRVEMKKLTSSEASIPVSLTYAPEDLVGRNGGAIKAADVELELMKVARDLLLRARELQLGVCQETDDPSLGALQNYAATAYVLPPSQASATFDPATGVLLLEVKDMKFVGGVSFNLTNNESDADAEFIERFARRHSPRLKAQPNHIVDLRAVEQDKIFLGSLRPISQVGDPSVSDDELIYNITRRPEKVSLTLTGAGSYSPEDQFLGEVEIAGENFAHRDETYSLKLTGGSERQQGELSFVVPPASGPRPSGGRIRFAGFRANVQYFQDKDQRLGNPNPIKLRDRETSFGATLSFEFDSFGDKDYIDRAEGLDKGRRRVQHQLRGDFGFDYRDVRIRPRDSLLPELTNGRQAAPNFELLYLLSGDVRRGKGGGIGELNFFAHAKAQKGISILGGDFEYDQYLLSAGAQVVFGFASPSDAFLSYQRGAGVGSKGTPLFELFRLGGSQFGRGLEEGEFIGRGLAYDRTELGVGVLPLWSLLRRAVPGAKRKPGDGASDDSTSGPPVVAGIDLSTVYLKVFYDRARLADTSSLGDVLNPSRGVEGYSAALELRGLRLGGRRANLTLGYARSPDSRLHRRGVVVTGLSYAF